MGAIEKPLFGVIGDVHAFHDDLRRIRQDIHAHPETAFEEKRTSDLVASKLALSPIDIVDQCAAVSAVARALRPTPSTAKTASVQVVDLTVLNLVHSDRSNCGNPSFPAGWSDS